MLSIDNQCVVQQELSWENMTLTKLTNHRHIGQCYEETAAEYLTQRFLSLNCEKFFGRTGEIDLIMREKQTLVFVEVKYRKNKSYGHAAEAVTPGKTKKTESKQLGFGYRNKAYRLMKQIFVSIISAIHHYGEDIDWFQNAITPE
ncbi:YraN family protein [Vibrio sp. PP-XX7]